LTASGRHAANGAWIIAGVPHGDPATGGGIRAHRIFAGLASRTEAAVISSSGGRALAAGLLRRPRFGTRLASAQFIRPPGLRALSLLLKPVVVDMHDHPVLQADALGIPLDPEQRRRAERLVIENVTRFERIVVPSRSFVDLCRIPPDRALVISNGTDTATILPEPVPVDGPVVAMASGAAPGRGIESLVEAVRQVRDARGEVRLALALNPTGAGSTAYLAELQATILDAPWIEVFHPSYATMSTFLGRATVVAVPHPPSAYFDVATPIKLFDAMAAGRPVVVTPRTETARIVADADAGIVAGDTIDDLAGALAEILDAPERAQRLGLNGRQAVVREYDWRSLSDRLADSVLAGSRHGQKASR
jgi:glycosyltransferase involved in cell wall biosynthesis